jgi:hypothetical protein
MLVTIDVTEEELEGDYGSVQGVILTCSRCGYSVEVFGTEENSVSRGAAMLRDECPSGESNYYKAS